MAGILPAREPAALRIARLRMTMCEVAVRERRGETLSAAALASWGARSARLWADGTVHSAALANFDSTAVRFAIAVVPRGAGVRPARLGTISAKANYN